MFAKALINLFSRARSSQVAEPLKQVAPVEPSRVARDVRFVEIILWNDVVTVRDAIYGFTFVSLPVDEYCPMLVAERIVSHWVHDLAVTTNINNIYPVVSCNSVAHAVLAPKKSVHPTMELYLAICAAIVLHD